MGSLGADISKYFEYVKDTDVIDSWTFKLMGLYTPAWLILSSVLVGTRQVFGEPIRCDAGLFHASVSILNMLKTRMS